jgi:hypothetical protein
MQDFRGTTRDYSCVVIMRRLSGQLQIGSYKKSIKQEDLYPEERT